MIADPDRADTVLIRSLKACRDTLPSCGNDPVCVARTLFAAAIDSLEPEARRFDAIRMLPLRDVSRIPLLPAFWALPYDERLAVALLHVETFDIALAAPLSRAAPEQLRERAETGLSRLRGEIPHASSH